MRIFITNDDGIHAPGLAALYAALEREHQVWVVAPESEQSAVGHSITLADPIRVKEVQKNGRFFGFALSGTPADCVRLGVSELVQPQPQAVVSGINLGPNVGINLLYSGTVSAANEAAILGLPALAVSLNTYTDPDFSLAAEIACRLLSKWTEIMPARGVSFNVNVPALPREKIKGLIWTRQSTAVGGEEFSRRVDPRGNIYYWRGKENPPRNSGPDSDFFLLGQGYITVTPLHHDLTNIEELARLSNYKIDL